MTGQNPETEIGIDQSPEKGDVFDQDPEIGVGRGQGPERGVGRGQGPEKGVGRGQGPETGVVKGHGLEAEGEIKSKKKTMLRKEVSSISSSLHMARTQNKGLCTDKPAKVVI